MKIKEGKKKERKKKRHKDGKRKQKVIEKVRLILNSGRKGIHELVAFYHTQTEDSDDISDSDIDLTSDSEIVDGNDENNDDQNQRGNALAIEVDHDEEINLYITNCFVQFFPKMCVVNIRYNGSAGTRLEVNIFSFELI